MNRSASTVNLDYQSRAREFTVNDWVTPIGADNTDVGRVTRVWPGIGMLDVEWATGHARSRIEDVTRIKDGVVQAPGTDNTPGGPAVTPQASRVARAYVKQAIYWASTDRRYRATRSETTSRNYHCPKCRDSETPLRKAIYKRQDGQSERLMACPSCLFLIRTSDIDGCHHNPPAEEVF